MFVSSVFPLYIFWFLHQTTTRFGRHPHTWALYIFWFLHQTTTVGIFLLLFFRCISFDSYIKPQRRCRLTAGRASCISFDSYIKPQPCASFWLSERVVYLLIPTSNHNRPSKKVVTSLSCISFDSYIKPQPLRCISREESVVYLLIPTSNHNWDGCVGCEIRLYIFWFLHQTTTARTNCCAHSRLYIFWFLHQTTTLS